MLSPTYEITTALSHTDELISPPYDIAIVTISYGRVIMSSVWDSMMSKKNVGWPFYAAVVFRSRSRCVLGRHIHTDTVTFLGLNLQNKIFYLEQWSIRSQEQLSYKNGYRHRPTQRKGQNVFYDCAPGDIRWILNVQYWCLANLTPCPWLSARLQWLQCVSNGDTAVLH